jgi:ABC-type nickel/cobalt efflux system permease component RcnA
MPNVVLCPAGTLLQWAMTLCAQHNSDCRALTNEVTNSMIILTIFCTILFVCPAGTLLLLATTLCTERAL